MELTCGLRDGVSGNGTGKRHMVMGTAKLEASWLSFLPVRDRMLLRGRGEQGKKRDNKDTKKQHITLKWLYRDSVSRKEPNPDKPHIGCSVSTLTSLSMSVFSFWFFKIIFDLWKWHYFLKIIVFYFIEKQKGANRSLQRTAMITASHAYLVTRSKNIKKKKKWHVFSGSPIRLQRKSVKATLTPLIKSIAGQPCRSNHLGGQITMLCSRNKKERMAGAVKDESNFKLVRAQYRDDTSETCFSQ